MNTMNTSTITTTGSIHILRRMCAVILVLAIIGIGVSTYLTHIHYATHTDENYKSVCAVSDEINCETVARSPYSVFLGAPVSVWGIFGYVMIAVFAAWGLFGRRLRDEWPVGILTALVLSAASASVVLGYISFTRIDSLCLFCMTSYGINAVLTIVIAVSLVTARINPIFAFFSDMKAFFRKPVLFAAVAVPAVGAILGLMFGITPYWQRPGWNDLPTLDTGVTADGIHWIGAKKPILTIVEFSDYQCPFCRRAHRDVRMAAGKFPDEVRLVHRHYPLDEKCNKKIHRAFHEYACHLSRAAICAAEQDKFWDMNDALFSIQDSIKAADVNVEHLAVELGLDRSQFIACMKRPEVPAEIPRDIAEGERLQLAGTPTFFINGKAYEGGVPESVIQKTLAAIHQKRNSQKPAASNAAKQ